MAILVPKFIHLLSVLISSLAVLAISSGTEITRETLFIGNMGSAYLSSLAMVRMADETLRFVEFLENEIISRLESHDGTHVDAVEYSKKFFEAVERLKVSFGKLTKAYIDINYGSDLEYGRCLFELRLSEFNLLRKELIFTFSLSYKKLSKIYEELSKRKLVTEVDRLNKSFNYLKLKSTGYVTETAAFLGIIQSRRPECDLSEIEHNKPKIISHYVEDGAKSEDTLYSLYTGVIIKILCDIQDMASKYPPSIESEKELNESETRLHEMDNIYKNGVIAIDEFFEELMDKYRSRGVDVDSSNLTKILRVMKKIHVFSDGFNTNLIISSYITLLILV